MTQEMKFVLGREKTLLEKKRMLLPIFSPSPYNVFKSFLNQVYYNWGL